MAQVTRFDEGVAYERANVWDAVGKDVSAMPTFKDALDHAGLLWKVTKEPAFTAKGAKVDGLWLVTRDTDGRILGHVGDQWQATNPETALEFMDDLLKVGKDEGIRLSTAGLLNGGKRIWINAKGPQFDIMGMPFDPFFIVTTSFDGSTSNEVLNSITCPVCRNTLEMARHNATRKFKVRHSSKLEDRLEEARKAFKMGITYRDAIAAKGQRYARRKVTSAEFNMIANELFGDEDMMTGRQKDNAMHLKSQFGVALRRPDLDNFKGTAWHVFNAMGDFASHLDPVRKTARWQESLWESFLDGNEWLLKTEKVLDELVGA